MKQTRRMPFDLEKAKRGAKVVTRCGYPVRIGFFDLEGTDLPIVAAIKMNGKETPFEFTIEGNFYPEKTEDEFDLFIEDEVEETDDYNPYKEVVKSISDMVEGYSELQSLEDLKDFYDNIKVKCREAVEYDKKWCKKQEEQKTSDSLKIMPDKWYLCTRGACLWSEDGINYTSFMEGVYLGADILKCNLSFEHEYYQKYFRYWDIKDAMDGDVLCYETKDEFRIFIYKNGHVYFHCQYYNGHLTTVDSYFVIPKHLLCYIHPATKEQRDILFQKMKESGYEWNPDTKELKKIDVDMAEKKIKTRKMTYKELSWWLREHPEEHREYTHEDIRKSSSNVYSCYDYNTSYADEEVNEYIRIRKNGGEWMEPLIEE